VERAFNAMGDLFVLTADLVEIGENPLGVLAFSRHQGHMGFERFAFRSKLFVFAPKRGYGINDPADFRFNLFCFAHKPIIPLEGVVSNQSSVISED
jgi:hypothetical protein